MIPGAKTRGEFYTPPATPGSTSGVKTFFTNP